MILKGEGKTSPFLYVDKGTHWRSPKPPLQGRFLSAPNGGRPLSPEGGGLRLISPLIFIPTFHVKHLLHLHLVIVPRETITKKFLKISLAGFIMISHNIAVIYLIV